MRQVLFIMLVAGAFSLSGCVTTGLVNQGADKIVDAKSDIYKTVGTLIDADQKMARAAVCTGATDRYNAEELTAEQYAAKIALCKTHGLRILPEGVEVVINGKINKEMPLVKMTVQPVK